MIKKLLFALILTTFSLNVSADEWIMDASVKQVYTGYEDSRLYFKLSKNINPKNCPKPNTYIIQEPYNTKGALATLLTAKAMKSTVSVRVSSTVCGHDTYPSVVTVLIN